MFKHVALALAALIAVPTYSGPVVARDIDWDWNLGSGNPSVRMRHHRARAKYARRHNKSDATKVMAYVKREGERDEARIERREFHCADKVRGVGTQWIGPEGALDTAKKDWMERVRYDYGESFLDMTNAKDFVSRCGRTSIGEVAGQVMYRCEIMARPCKADMQESKATTK
jgi:hypothetical protein